MVIECLQRELAVCHHAEIEAFLAADPGRWQVISIREPDHPEAVLTQARKAHAVVFEDVFTPEGTHGHGPKPAHLQGILRFVAQSGREPLVFQCWAGRSRSTAVALVVIVKMLWEQGIDGPELLRRRQPAGDSPPRDSQPPRASSRSGGVSASSPWPIAQQGLGR